MVSSNPYTVKCCNGSLKAVKGLVQPAFQLLPVFFKNLINGFSKRTFNCKGATYLFLSNLSSYFLTK